MGYVKTITQIAKELGRTVKEAASHGLTPKDLRDPFYSANEMYQFLQGAVKVNPKEFGRFGHLGFSPLQDEVGRTVAGEYLPRGAQGRGAIFLNPEESGYTKLQDFLHEFAHAKQFRPDPKNVPLMRNWEVASDNLKYDYQPIEIAANKVSKVATPNPALFTKASDDSLTDPRIKMYVQEGLLDTRRPQFSDVRPYSGKGWLFGVTPIFAAPALQTGREDS